jgi:hypothetical protein
VLGRGGMATVFRPATSSITGRPEKIFLADGMALVALWIAPAPGAGGTQSDGPAPSA